MFLIANLLDINNEWESMVYLFLHCLRYFEDVYLKTDK